MLSRPAASGTDLLLAAGSVEGHIELWTVRDGEFQQLPAAGSALGGDAHVAIIDAHQSDQLLTAANAALGFLTPLSNRATATERWPAGHTHPITAIAGARHRTGDILITSGDRHGNIRLCRTRADGTASRPVSRLTLGHASSTSTSPLMALRDLGSHRAISITLAPDPAGTAFSASGPRHPYAVLARRLIGARVW